LAGLGHRTQKQYSILIHTGGVCTTAFIFFFSWGSVVSFFWWWDPGSCDHELRESFLKAHSSSPAYFSTFATIPAKAHKSYQKEVGRILKWHGARNREGSWALLATCRAINPAPKMGKHQCGIHLVEINYSMQALRNSWTLQRGSTEILSQFYSWINNRSYTIHCMHG